MLVAWSKAQVSSGQNRLTQRFDKYRDRPLVDLGLLIHQRDRESAGAVLGSAVAFRMFLFFVPLLLFVVGLAGFVATWVDADSVNDGASITGTLAVQIDTALSQSSGTRWVAVLLGLFGMATTGRTLSKVLVAASCLAWRLPMSSKASVRVDRGDRRADRRHRTDRRAHQPDSLRARVRRRECVVRRRIRCSTAWHGSCCRCCCPERRRIREH